MDNQHEPKWWLDRYNSLYCKSWRAETRVMQYAIAARMQFVRSMYFRLTGKIIL